MHLREMSGATNAGQATVIHKTARGAKPEYGKWRAFMVGRAAKRPHRHRRDLRKDQRHNMLVHWTLLRCGQ